MENQKITYEISTKSIIKIILAIISAIMIFILRDVVAIFLICLILVTAMSPIVSRLKKFKIPPSVSVLMFYVIFFGFLGFLLYSIVPQLAVQIREMAEDFPKFVDQLNQIFGRVPNHEQIASGFQQGLKNLETDMASSAATIFAPLFKIFGGIVTFIVILVLTLYMTVAEDDIKKFFQSIFPKRYEQRVEKSIIKIQRKIGQWVRGEFVLMLSVGLITFVGLSLMGVRFALTLAIIAGLLELIPFIGPILSSVPAIFIAFTQAPMLGLLVVLLYIGIQQFENHVLVPKVMERTTGISPVVVVLSLLIGAKLMGFLGALLAVPVAVILSVFVEEIIERNSQEA